MKLFETAIKNFMCLGLAWDESSKKYAYTKKIYFVSFLCALFVFSTLVFLFYEAKTFYEYALAFMAFSSAIAMFIACTALDLEVNQFNNFVGNCQNMVNQSE